MLRLFRFPGASVVLETTDGVIEVTFRGIVQDGPKAGQAMLEFRAPRSVDILRGELVRRES